MIRRCTKKEQGTDEAVSLESMREDAAVRTRIDDCILKQ